MWLPAGRGALQLDEGARHGLQPCTVLLMHTGLLGANGACAEHWQRACSSFRSWSRPTQVLCVYLVTTLPTSSSWRQPDTTAGRVLSSHSNRAASRMLLPVQAWYPVASLKDLDPARPHGLMLLGEFACWAQLVHLTMPVPAQSHGLRLPGQPSCHRQPAHPAMYDGGLSERPHGSASLSATGAWHRQGMEPDSCMVTHLAGSATLQAAGHCQQRMAAGRAGAVAPVQAHCKPIQPAATWPCLRASPQSHTQTCSSHLQLQPLARPPQLRAWTSG